MRGEARRGEARGEAGRGERRAEGSSGVPRGEAFPGERRADGRGGPRRGAEAHPAIDLTGDVRQWGRATAELLGAMLFGTAVAADSTGILGHGPSMGLAAAELLVTTQLGDTNCKPVNGAGTSTSRRTKAHMD